MRRLGFTAGLGMLCACAITPAPMPVPSSPQEAPATTSHAQIQRVSASSSPRAAGPRIGKADLDQARALLSDARDELEPHRWALLDSRLAKAERAWERFNTVAKASGRAAEVARGAEGLAEAGRTSETVKGLEALRRAGPLLAVLILLWPSSTAGPEFDELPPWLNAQLEFEARLREVSEASQRVRAEIEATRRSGSKPPGEDAAKARPPKGDSKEAPEPQAGGQGQPPGAEPPCFHKGTSGSGAFRNENAPPGWMKCTYQGGEEEVPLLVWGTSDSDCGKPINFERAERKAAQQRAEKQRAR